MHALSVSLNKLGDLKYYAQDLATARTFYSRALELRQQATDLTELSSQVRTFKVSFNCLSSRKGLAHSQFRCIPVFRTWKKLFRGSHLTTLVSNVPRDQLILTLDVLPSVKVLDVAVSLAKVADVNRALGNEGSATEGFEEAVKMLGDLPKPSTKEQLILETRVSSFNLPFSVPAFPDHIPRNNY